MANFHALFNIAEDPEHVVIDFKQARVVDDSALVAVDNLAARYRAAGKQLHFRQLSQDCHALLQNANNIIEGNLLEDPNCRVPDDELA